MTDYSVKFTDKSKLPIVISENNVNNTATDISLFGRKRLEYGKDMNANFLHILENFACPENPLLPGTPNLTKASNIADTTKKLLSSPVEGQLWYNTTQESLFVWNSNTWLALGMTGDIAANWGVIAHGSQLPKPVNKYGYIFDYDECAWIVSPFVFESSFTYMQCVTDESARVTMIYTPEGSGTQVTGCANYLIVGIKGNINRGSRSPIPSATPAPSTTPTPTPTRSSTPVVSPTASVTPTPGVSPTPTPSVTMSPTPQPSVTPSATTLNYSTTISANPAGSILPGGTICYTIRLNYPAPPGGYNFVFTRSGNYETICASTNSETSGPIIEQINLSIPHNSTSIEVCRAAPLPPTPTPTPTAAPRYGCKLVPGNPAGSGGTYWHGFMCANTPGGANTYFTNANSNYSPCTANTACNTATSFTSTQTIPLNPVRENVQRYNATPAVQLELRIRVDGIGVTSFSHILQGTTPQSVDIPVSVGSRRFTVRLNMTPTLLSSTGNIRTWQLTSDYKVIDNDLNGIEIGFC